MAFPDDPQEAPASSGDQSPHHEPASFPNSELPPHDGGGEPVTGELVTDASHTHLDETHSYADDWSSSYGQPGNAVTLTPPAPPAPPPPSRPPGGSGSPPGPPEPPEEEEEEEEGMARMSFLEHLEELRSRILRALAGMGIAFAICLFLGPQLWDIIRQPAKTALEHLNVIPPDLALIDPMDAFQIIWMKIPLLCAIFLSSPWVLYQVWAFISPGLYKRERRWAAPFVISSSLLFIMGGLFAYFVAFRYGLEFLLGLGIGSGIHPVVDVNRYYEIFVDVMLGVGVIFEIPVLLFLLTLIRVANPAFLVRHSRYAILAIVVLAAVITPTGDIFNLALFATPMIILFYIGIFASYLLVLKRENRRFPWPVFLKWFGIGLVVVAAASYLIAQHYGIHFVGKWPFLTR
ncbi:MAG TPA: twin-arginine translocase subunit TatC [Bryobacteraceae bacterium]|nr:twin-arginine translocase subunit TatC [Bryobacteraceae bacterium]